MPRPGCCRLSYWVLTPEVGADDVVTALRGSWLKDVPPAQIHYVVANTSTGRDATLHRLPLPRGADVPLTRDEFFGNGRLLNPQKREVYNSFLRRKVFAIIEAMSAMAAGGAFDYGVLLDADTAVNVSNLELLTKAIPQSGDASVYTGRCQQEPLLMSSSGQPIASRGTFSLGVDRLDKRYDVAQYIERRRLHGPSTPWPPTIPPSPGGGPGLIFSRGLLAAVRPYLSQCAPLTGWNAMGDTIFAGGDSMITRCLASLGVRCATERDMRLHDPGRCPFAHGCSLAALFRKNPPWFYRAAGNQKRARRASRRAHPTEALGLASPLHETVAFHHVKPSSRTSGMGIDPRCAVRMRADPQGRAGWWGSSCLPNFVLVGAPHAGANAVLRVVRAHAEVVAPAFKGLDFFEKTNAKHEAASRGELLRLYANHFPQIDPRDFRLTGESTPTYLYDPKAPDFFAHTHLRMLRIVIVLREPAARALAALSTRRARESKVAEKMLIDAQGVASRCGMAALYEACEPCRRFAALAAIAATPDAATPDCVDSVQNMEALNEPNNPAAMALWRSWYHLFLPRWLSLRPLVLFAEELKGGTALKGLAEHLKLEPPTLEEGHLGELLEKRPKGNLSSEAVAAVRALTSEVATEGGKLLEPRGVRVPAAWRR